MEEIHHALERRLGADGEVKRGRLFAEIFLKFPHDAEKVRVFSPHLAQVERHGKVVFRRRFPGVLGLDLHAVYRAGHQHHSVGHVHAGTHFPREVRVSRGVQKVEGFPLVWHGGQSGVDRDLAFLLFEAEVESGVPVFYLPQPGGHPRIEQHCLCECRLSSAAMACDHDGPDVLRFLGHTRPTSSRLLPFARLFRIPVL